MLEKLVAFCDGRGLTQYSLLYIATYAFLLRLPSEALPMEAGQPGVGRSRAQSVLTRSGDEIVLRLERRCVLGGDPVYIDALLCELCSGRTGQEGALSHDTAGARSPRCAHSQGDQSARGFVDCCRQRVPSTGWGRGSSS